MKVKGQFISFVSNMDIVPRGHSPFSNEMISSFYSAFITNSFDCLVKYSGQLPSDMALSLPFYYYQGYLLLTRMLKPFLTIEVLRSGMDHKVTNDMQSLEQFQTI